MRVPTAVPDMQRLPLTVVGGDARTGKTTLLRQLTTQRHDGGAVVVLEGTEDLSAELAELRGRLSPASHVLVEARGDASLRRVAGYAYMPGYRPDGTVVVMGALDMDASLDDSDRREAMTTRLRSADILIMNMADVVAPAVRVRCQRWLDAEMPRLRVIEPTQGRVAGMLLLGVTPEAARHDARAVPGSWDASTYRTVGRKRLSRVARSAEPPCRLWRLETHTSIAVRRFRSWISLLPRSVVRAAGSVLVEEDPRHRYQFRMIGHRWQLRREEPWGAAAPETRVALVGT